MASSTGYYVVYFRWNANGQVEERVADTPSEAVALMFNGWQLKTGTPPPPPPPLPYETPSGAQAKADAAKTTAIGVSLVNAIIFGS